MKKFSLFLGLFGILFLVNCKLVWAEITLNRNNVTIGVGYKVNLYVNNDTSFNPNEVSWYSTNDNVASVSNGVVTTKGVGSTVITASWYNYRATCLIQVINNYVEIKTISLNSSSEELYLNETRKLKVNISPDNATDKNLLYTSSNSQIVSIDSNGNMTGMSQGNAVISVSSSSGNAKASLMVRVVNTIGLKGISIRNQLTLNEGEGTTLTVSFNPSNATNKKITWKSSNPNVAVVDSSGNVFAKSSGNATIQAISEDNGYVASCQVTVNPVSKELKEITLNKDELTLSVNDEETLTVNFNPSYTDNKDIKWESSDKKIATVSAGVVKGIKPGTVEIKAINEKTKLYAICKVTIVAPSIKGISFEKERQTVYVGSKTTLKTISDPVGSVLDNAIWSSSDLEIATVEGGVVTAKKVGTVVIMVANEDNSIKSEMTLEVMAKPVVETALKIKVKGYDLEFDPKIKEYTLQIGDESSLIFELNIDKKKYTINGNKDLKNGSIITITLTDKEQTQYIFYIKKKENKTILFIGIISGLLILNIIRMLIKNKKKR